MRANQMEPVDRADQWLRGAVGSGIGAELRATLALGGPFAAANVAQVAMGVTDMVMVGHLGALPLAAAGLGAMLYFTGGVVLQGILSAVAPLAAHALGAGDRAAAARIGGAGLALALLLALLFVAALTSLDRLLQWLGYNAALAVEIGHFLRAIAWGGPAFLGFAVLRSLLAALSQSRAVMAVLLLCVAGNAGLNWVLIYGHLGAPALGVAGSGFAGATNQWLILAGSGRVGLPSGIGFMSGTAVVLWTVPEAIITVYIDIADTANRATVEIARRLLVIAALFQVFDGMQTIAAGALRGYKDTMVPMLLAGFGYWGAGFGGGWLLAFPLGYGAVGLWWGLALGLAVVAILLTLRLHLLAPPVTPAAEVVGCTIESQNERRGPGPPPPPRGYTAAPPRPRSGRGPSRPPRGTDWCFGFA